MYNAENLSGQGAFKPSAGMELLPYFRRYSAYDNRILPRIAGGSEFVSVAEGLALIGGAGR